MVYPALHLPCLRASSILTTSSASHQFCALTTPPPGFARLSQDTVRLVHPALHLPCLRAFFASGLRQTVSGHRALGASSSAPPMPQGILRLRASLDRLRTSSTWCIQLCTYHASGHPSPPSLAGPSQDIWHMVHPALHLTHLHQATKPQHSITHGHCVQPRHRATPPPLRPPQGGSPFTEVRQ